MAGRVLRAVVMVLGMLAMVQQTMQLKITKPLPNLETLGHKGTIPIYEPYLAIILASSTNEKALNETGFFNFHAYVDIAGRRFRLGRFGVGSPVVAVVSGATSSQAAVTTQILIDYFPTRAIFHIGSALTVDSSLSVGSVSVVKSAAFTGLWTWWPLLERLGEAEPVQLKFQDYSPEARLNYLGSLLFEKVKVFEREYTPTSEKVFWHDVNADLYEAATYIKDVDLKQCYNSTHCLPNKPEIAFGLKASTADIYLENPVYAKFLRNNFDVSTVDEESATVIMTANANGVPIIVFRAASSSLARPYDSDFSYVASYNGALVAAKFISMLPRPLVNSS